MGQEKNWPNKNHRNAQFDKNYKLPGSESLTNLKHMNSKKRVSVHYHHISQNSQKKKRHIERNDSTKQQIST